MKISFPVLMFIICLNLNAFSKEKFPYFLENTFSGPLNYIEQPYDVLEYNLIIDLSSTTYKQAAGHNQITVYWKNHNSDNQFIYHLVSLKTDSIFIDGKKTVPLIHGNEKDGDFYISATVPGGIHKDTSIVDIFYGGIMTSIDDYGGVNYWNGILFNMGTGFYNKYISAARHWMPCYDHPSDKAKFKASFIVPKGKKVASNGKLVKTEYLDNGTDIIHYEHNYQIATYLMNFAMGDLQLFENKYNEIPIEIYGFHEDSTLCSYFYHYLPKMVEAYEYYYGKYPFEKVGYVNVDNIQWGALEHQTMISLDRSWVFDSQSFNDSLNYVIFHELAHQWFGDAVSILDFRDVWFSESFADYSESLFYEYFYSHHPSFNKEYGFEIYIKKTIADMNEYLNSAIPNEGYLPLYDFKSINPTASNYPYTIYFKGGVVIQMLRYKIADEAFFASLKDIQANFKYKNITTTEVKTIFEKHYGSDLTVFFNQWIYSLGYPVLDIKTSQNADNLVLNIKQIQNSSWGIFTDFPLNIKIKTESSVIDSTIIINEKTQNISIELNSNKIISKSDIVINKSEKFVTLMTYNLSITDVNDEISNKNYSLVNRGNSLEVDYSNFNSNSITFTIIDLLGNSVYQNQYSSINGIFNFSIDINSLQSGSYFIILRDGKKLSTEKFIKLN